MEQLSTEALLKRAELLGELALRIQPELARIEVEIDERSEMDSLHIRSNNGR